MANKKYEEVDKLLKQWKKDKSQDINIIRGWYNTSHLEKNPMVERNEDLTKGTKFTNMTNEQFVELFEADKFCSLDKKGLKHLFQELHNRYISDKGFDVTRNVAVLNDKSTTAYGYVCAADDLMFINKHAIDKAKTVEPDKSNFNKTNIGYSLFYVISHESQHVAQFESSLDYALGKKQDKDTEFVAAMTAIEDINMSYDEANESNTFLWNWKTHYDYQFIEHNANYSAFQHVRNILSDDKKKGKSFDQYNEFTTRLALRDNVPMTKDPKLFIDERIARMEEFTKYEIEYFQNHIKDCSMKDKLLATANEFMKVDENGNSPFRDKLRKEIGEMVEVSLESRKNLYKDKKNSQVKNSKQIEEEVLMQL